MPLAELLGTFGGFFKTVPDIVLKLEQRQYEERQALLSELNEPWLKYHNDYTRMFDQLRTAARATTHLDISKEASEARRKALLDEFYKQQMELAREREDFRSKIKGLIESASHPALRDYLLVVAAYFVSDEDARYLSLGSSMEDAMSKTLEDGGDRPFATISTALVEEIKEADSLDQIDLLVNRAIAGLSVKAPSGWHAYGAPRISYN